MGLTRSPEVTTAELPPCLTQSTAKPSVWMTVHSCPYCRMESSASASFLAGGSSGPLPPLRDRETVQHPFSHSQGADVETGRGSCPRVSSPPPTRPTTSLPNNRASVPLLNCQVTPESACLALGWVAGLSLSDLTSAAAAVRSQRQPKDLNLASTFRASVGVNASFPVMILSLQF
jgi:hypothetical protein